jgi:hypothetical protein
MEPDELKDIWAQHNKKLARNLKLNEALLRKMNLDGAKRELRKPLMYELFGIVLMSILVIILLTMTIRNIDEPKFSISGSFSVLIAGLYLVFAIVKANRFFSIDHYGNSIVTLQRDVTKLNQLVLRLRKYELMLIPCILLSFPLLFKETYQLDISAKASTLWLMAAIVIGIGIPTTLWINKQVYDRKFQNAGKFLKAIDDFESDMIN